MSKIAICLYGISNTGKSSTIRMIYNLLISKYPEAIKEIVNIGKTDITVVLTIKGIKIGIESQGDPNSRLENSLSMFIKIGCSIIVCASRTRGKTYNLVSALEPNYKLIRLYKTRSISEIESNNTKMAMKVLEEINNQIHA